jgi:hypothetical protein
LALNQPVLGEAMIDRVAELVVARLADATDDDPSSDGLGEDVFVRELGVGRLGQANDAAGHTLPKSTATY